MQSYCCATLHSHVVSSVTLSGSSSSTFASSCHLITSSGRMSEPLNSRIRLLYDHPWCYDCHTWPILWIGGPNLSTDFTDGKSAHWHGIRERRRHQDKCTALLSILRSTLEWLQWTWPTFSYTKLFEMGDRYVGTYLGHKLSLVRFQVFIQRVRRVRDQRLISEVPSVQLHKWQSASCAWLKSVLSANVLFM